MTNTSSPTLDLTEQLAALTISPIDRNILRQKLAVVRQEIDATIQLIDKTSQPLKKETFEILIMRWHELLIATLNTRT